MFETIFLFSFVKSTITYAIEAFHVIQSYLGKLIEIFSSESACNFGTFLSGLALILGLMVWKMQKRHEMKIKIANEALNFLDDYKMEIDLMLEVINFVNGRENSKDIEKPSVKGIVNAK